MGALTPLFSLIHDFFVVYLPKERQCSPHTIRAYRNSLGMLLDFVKEKRGVKLNEITLEMINRTMILEFLNYLENERKCSVTTRNHRLHCIRAFYNYAAVEDITVVAHLEEVHKVQSAKVPDKLVEHMSEAAVKAILAQPDTRKEQGLRDMVMMLVLYKTGARVQELLDIRLCDIKFGKYPFITLYGKGAKVRSVPLRDNVTEHLKRYIDRFHSKEDACSAQHLFFTKRNGAKKRMTEDNVRHMVRQYGNQARIVCPEVPEGVHPHLFRHSCAMALYQNGLDLTLISQWLGHSNLETTLIYAHADTELKRQAIEKAIPDDSALKEHINADRYKLTDEDMLKRLCGLK